MTKPLTIREYALAHMRVNLTVLQEQMITTWLHNPEIQMPGRLAGTVTAYRVFKAYQKYLNPEGEDERTPKTTGRGHRRIAGGS